MKGEIEFDVLFELYFQPRSSAELTREKRAACQRLAKKGLAFYDHDRSHLMDSEPSCWSISPEGEQLVERLNAEALVAEGERESRGPIDRITMSANWADDGPVRG